MHHNFHCCQHVLGTVLGFATKHSHMCLTRFRSEMSGKFLDAPTIAPAAFFSGEIVSEMSNVPHPCADQPSNPAPA
jgi:hypothetical protein